MKKLMILMIFIFNNLYAGICEQINTDGFKDQHQNIYIGYSENCLNYKGMTNLMYDVFTVRHNEFNNYDKIYSMEEISTVDFDDKYLFSLILSIYYFLEDFEDKNDLYKYSLEQIQADMKYLGNIKNFDNILEYYKKLTVDICYQFRGNMSLERCESKLYHQKTEDDYFGEIGCIGGGEIHGNEIKTFQNNFKYFYIDDIYFIVYQYDNSCSIEKVEEGFISNPDLEEIDKYIEAIIYE